MKFVFLVILVVLSAISTAAWLASPEHVSKIPVLYWVTDPNPARVEQVRLFREWLKVKGHPDIDVRVDTSNQAPEKKIIQTVSGVAGDLIDLYDVDTPFFVSMGVIEDVTEPARAMGFGPERTFAALEPALKVDGKQYRFPANVNSDMLWVNKGTFAKWGQAEPPSRWTWDEFERVGKDYVAAANPPGQRLRNYFVNTLDLSVMRRSAGLDVFNETLTRCTLDDPINAKVLARYAKWVFEDRILPTAAEAESFAAGAGYGGAVLQLFHTGQYAMIKMGRFGLIQMRQMEALEMKAVEPPHEVLPVTNIFARGVAVYRGSKHKAEAELFLSFLAGRTYNGQVVEDADGLPPNPEFVHEDAFAKPAKYRNEWEMHTGFAKGAEEIAIAASNSPFVLSRIVQRLESAAQDSVMRSRRLTPEQAGREAARQVNAEIDRTILENSSLREEYTRRVQLQTRIEEYRAAGKKVPLAWISNSFYRKWYVLKGWAE